MSLASSKAIVFFSNHPLAGADCRAVRIGAGGCERQDLAPGRHARSSSDGVSGCLQRCESSLGESFDDLPEVVVKALLIFSTV